MTTTSEPSTEPAVPQAAGDVSAVSRRSFLGRGAAVGAGAGAIVGAATTGSVLGTAVGAGVGGVVGAAAGNVLGRASNDSNICIYERPNGSRYRDTCPQG